MQNPRNLSIAVVTRPTRLALLMRRWTTRSACKFHLEQAHAHELERRGGGVAIEEADGGNSSAADLAAAEFDQYEAEDREFRETLRFLRQELDIGYPLAFVDRSFLPSFDFSATAAVVVVGQDGLVANVAKYAGDLPIVGVNPDSARLDGVLLPFSPVEARAALAQAIAGRAAIRDVTLAQVDLNDGQRLLAFNDFFIGAASHISARYILAVDGRSEPHSSSGLIVATGAGSTGWLSSVFNMAAGVAAWRETPPPPALRLELEDRRLAWVAREPFRSKQSSADLVAGLLEEGDELLIESLMPENGVIFSDGVEADYLPFNSGAIARISAAEQRARLVVKDRQRDA
jgi:NAD kinase